MNKKFSTLMMMGMLVAGSSTYAQDAVSLGGYSLEVQKFGDAGKNTYSDVVVIRDANKNEKIDKEDLVLIAKKNAYTNELTYTAVAIPADGAIDLAGYELNSFLWKFAEEGIASAPGAKADSWYYSLTNNATGVPLTFDYTNGFKLVTDAEKCGDKADEKRSASFMTAWNSAKDAIKDNGKLYLYNKDGHGYNLLTIQNNGVPYLSGEKDDQSIILAKIGERTLVGDKGAKELNDVKGSKGFQFSFVDYKGKEVNDNIFKDQDLKAFYVKDAIIWTSNGNQYAIPAGIYLATDWSALDKEEDATVLNTFKITSKEQFNKMTFVAVHPQNSTTITLTDADRKTGKGFLLEAVKGSDMNVYDIAGSIDAENYNEALASTAGEVFVGNACFTIKSKGTSLDTYTYTLQAAKARLDLDATTGADKDGHTEKSVYVNVLKNINNVAGETGSFYYLVSDPSAAAKLATVPSTTIADVTELLHSDATPAIYAVKFLSGADEEDSEYGQYLTVGIKKDNSSFVGMTMPNANENDPLFQFVLSGVKDADGDDNFEIMTATNRQTGAPFSAVLYKEEALGENVYTIYPASQWTKIQVASVDNKGALKFEEKSYKGMLVQLIEKENVDKFATFETAQSEQGLYTFDFAKTAESDDRLYAAADRNTDGEINWTGAIKTSETADYFELIRVKNGKKDKVVYNLNDFVYKSGDRVVTSPVQKDTVASYVYKVRFFAPDQDKAHYLANDHKLSTTASDFVIKHNADGSVSLIQGNPFTTTTTSNDTKFNIVSDKLLSNFSKESKRINNVAWQSDFYYNFANVYNTEVKTFMVPEKVYGSLNPVPQTTEFKNVDNYDGYLFMNDNEAAVINPFESMTFYLDTVNVDANIPSFFIRTEDRSKFLYFANDSANSNRLTNWQKYAFENGKDRSTRLIFKEATRLDSDTLQMTIDGKPTMVSTKKNAVKGVQGGLNNFKFQVIESGDEDDTYVIRCKNGMGYVTSINGNLTLGSNLKGAARFEVNPKSVTANEGVEVAEVSVVAANGAVIVKGAAGKKVAISNILGQTIANTVVASDNATIAVPAGIVVVAVEGEDAVKVVVK